MKLEVEWQPSPTQLAEAFCALHANQQALFFVRCAEIAAQWPSPAADVMQWHYLGRELAAANQWSGDVPENEPGYRMVAEIWAAMTEDK